MPVVLKPPAVTLVAEVIEPPPVVLILPEVVMFPLVLMFPLVIAVPETLFAVVICASFVSAIAAEALMSALTIVPSRIIVEVTVPVSVV